MIIRKHGYVLDVDVEDTFKYSQEHGLCDCDEDQIFMLKSQRNFLN